MVLVTDIKDIVDIICIEMASDAPPVEFFVFDRTKHDKIMWISFISNQEELKRFENSRPEERKVFRSNSPKIYFPKMSISELREVEELDGKSLHYMYIMNRIRKTLPLKSENEKVNAYALYLVLHEIGHFQEFTQLNSNVFEMRNRDIPYYKNVQLSFESIKRDLGHKRELDEVEKRRVLQFHENYYSMPSEKNANIYADENFIRYYRMMGWV